MKRHLAIYYQPEAIADARLAREQARAEGHSAILVDVNAFSDIEQADGIGFVGDISEAMRDRITEAYRPTKRAFVILDPNAQSIAGNPRGLNPFGNRENGSDLPDIPEDWESWSFPELQKLAAALTQDAVRTENAARDIISEEIARRDALQPNEGKEEATGADRDPEDSNEEEQEAADGEEEAEEEVDLDSMTKAELIDYAEANDVDLGDAKNKADILAAIQLARE